jgi:prepilin-type processing-associated H-X9-DG protein
MNAFGASLVWTAVQVTLFALVGAVIYGLARRQSPAAGALAVLAILAGIIGLTGLMASPWPCWWSPMTEPPGEPRVAVDDSANDTPTSFDQATTGIQSQALPAGPMKHSNSAEIDTGWAGIWQQAWKGLSRDLSVEPSANPEAARWRWPAVLALLLMTGGVLGLTRLGLGAVALGFLRRRSQPVMDAELLDLLAILRAELGCTRPVEIRESDRVGTPATFGWRHPVVLLPNTWRSWSAVERQVVLAHEVAHIHRGDYPAGMLAHLGLALHFLNPLVHWLVSRLRIEQELAADHCAALLAGGRELYLVTLAQMALRLDRQGAAWGARPFLPTRETFLRRIQMLRDMRTLPSFPPTAGVRWLLLGSLAAMAILVAGLRGPVTTGLALAAIPGDTAPEESPTPARADLALVPEDVLFLMVVYPADLARAKKMEELVKVLNEATKLEADWGLPVQDIEACQLMMVEVEPQLPGPFGPFDRIAIRAKKAHDWLKAIKGQGQELAEETFQGRKYYKAARPAQGGGNFGYFIADERTLVLATEPQLKRAIDLSGQQPKAVTWAAAWESVAKGPVTVMANTARVREIVAAAKARNQFHGPEAAVMGTIGPLYEESQGIFLGAALDGEVTVQGLAMCSSEQAAEKVQKTAEAVVTMASNGLAELQKQLSRQPTEESPLIRQVLGFAEDLLSNAKIERQDKKVQLQAKSSKGDAVALLAPAVMKIREAANRTRDANNLKQIALAMHNYMDVHGHFPPAVSIGPDGKTPHSWRIDLLPYLEQDQLHKTYKMDEPWDSPANKKVLAQMPMVYRCPQANPRSLDSSYFVLMGGGSIFSKKEGTKIADITDGTSNTIMIVEAQRNIPWTKPDDISYDPQKPLPKLGGFYEQGFNVAFADGSVRFISNSIKEETLRALISMAGGEVIEGF